MTSAKISRRAVLGIAGGLAAAGTIGWKAGLGGRPAPAGLMHVAAFDLTTTDRERLITLLRRWTAASARMTQGLPAGAHAMDGPYDAPPDDTGEAWGLPPAGLTITIGFGRSLFVGPPSAPRDRFRIADRLPGALIDLPHFPADNLDPARGGGDLVVQACSDDAQVAVHAVRNLARIAMGTAQIRWTQLGFGRTSSTSTAQTTPRNLFGFKDGTRNVKAENPDQMAEHVWVGPGAVAADAQTGVDSSWMLGGSYLVARRIRMFLETWDRTSLREQEVVFGRDKGEGAPLSGGEELTDPDFSRMGSDGPLIDPASHVAMAHPDLNSGTMMLRRGYSYTDANDSLGRFDAGLFFLAYVVDPRTHYVPMQNAMSRSDLLMEYIQHTGSSLWAVPPGITDTPLDRHGLPRDAGPFIGQDLFT
jgi:deferrochelatase/peroxidase EfeB